MKFSIHYDDFSYQEVDAAFKLSFRKPQSEISIESHPDRSFGGHPLPSITATSELEYKKAILVSRVDHATLNQGGLTDKAQFPSTTTASSSHLLLAEVRVKFVNLQERTMTRKKEQQQLIVITASLLTSAAIAVLAAYYYERRRKWLITGPRAPKKPAKVLFGNVPGPTRGPDPSKLIDPPIEIEDPYYWLRDDTRKNREILNYIKEENSYTQAMTKHLKRFQKSIYNDLLKHLKQTDQEYPYPWGPFFYYTRTEEGKSYKIHCRKPSMDADAKETNILNPNEVVKKQGYKYFDIGSFQPSPDHTVLAYSFDTSGGETYDIHFKDIESGEALKDVIKETAGGVVWGADNSVVYYEKMDDTHRPYQLWRHAMGTDTKEDVMLFEEKDDRLWMHASKTDSERYIVMTVGGKIMTESHLIDLQGAKGAEEHAVRPLVLIEPRSEKDGEGHRYSVEHHGDLLYIVTNKDGALNSKIMTTSVTQLRAVNWVDCFPYDPAVKIDYLSVFKAHFVIHGREQGFGQLWIYDPASKQKHRLDQPEPVFCVYGSHNCVFESDVYRYEYSSPIKPRCTLEYNMKTKERKLLKQVEVPHYDKELYTCERLEATAKDGTKVPISLLYKKTMYDRKPPKPRGLVLYGYGSYGACMDPNFESNRIVLAEHGCAFAIAHIRGGGEMGRAWYEKEGKLKTKINTFTDFIACAEALIKMNLTSPELLAIWGASAGGLLIGAVVNMRPDLFKVAIMDVPFVDVLVTISDSTIPLTAVEWDEWGNSNELAYYEYIKQYSPVDNLRKQAYPAMLVTGGLWDPRVQYYEPVKWTAKLREHKTDNNPLLLKIDMSSGHFSASDRYSYLRERAFTFSFLLDQVGLGPSPPKARL